MQDKTFVIMAGGTGGHVFPALATAKALIRRNDKVVWIGSEGGMEEDIVRNAEIPFYGLSVKGVRGSGAKAKLSAPFKILSAVFQAVRIMLRVKPDAVLGLGGFASGPGGIAAKLLRKPLLIHEQNAIAGLTNVLLSRFASSVMCAFPNAFEQKAVNRRVKLTGNPLREELCEMFYRPGIKEQFGVERPVRLLVLGGSLGAASLNSAVPECLAQLPQSIKPEVWHQTGRGKSGGVREDYEKSGTQARVSEFIVDMAEAYRWADMVICRAGALTISELCIAGLGAILVPYPYAVDDHQTKNAEYMVQGGAAWLLPQTDLNPENLKEMLVPLFKKTERIELLSKAARNLAKPDATEMVANECRRVAYA